MSDVEKSKRITELPFATPLTGNEVIPVVQGGVTKQTTPQQIVGFVTKETVGLDKVQNLAPNEMPISDPVQAAIDQLAAKDHEHPGYVRATINEWD